MSEKVSFDENVAPFPAMYKALMKIKGTPTLWEYDEGGCPVAEVEE